ncbi:MAG: porin [Phycisphaerae bacterium]
MLKDRHWGCALGLLAAVVVVLPAWADDAAPPAAPALDETIARLEAQLAAQQERITQLQREVALASAQETEAERVEAMKQQIREVLSEQEFRESLMPAMLQAGYDEGFYIRSSDDKFLMKIGGLMQFRWTHYGTSRTNRYLDPGLQRNDRTGFDLQRLRINFRGHAFSKDLTYLLELQAEAPERYDAILSEAYVDYRFCEAFHFRAGRFKSASTRANTTAHSQLQLISRPMVDAVFGLGYNLGVRFWGQLFDKRLDWYLDVTNSLSDGENFGDGRTITNDPAELDSNPALAFRLVWHALGENGAKDFESQSDIEFHESPALDFGFHYAFNEDEGDLRTTRIPFPVPRLFRTGGFGLTSTNGLQINQWGLDAAFKCQGFSLIGEYIVRMVDPRRAGRRPFTPWWLLTRQGDTTVQHGAYAQAGYFLPIPGLEKKLEAVARVGGISALANGQEGVWEYGAGVNYYIEGQNVKLSADMFKVYEAPTSSSYKSLANVNDDALVFRVQLQLAF